MLQTVLLFFIALAGSFLTSAGVYALITVVGIVPRMAAKTNTANKMRYYESCIILGGTIGNALCFFGRYVPLLPVLRWGIMILIGLFSGIFVGCLVMALAESLQVMPIFYRRIRLSVGLPLVLASFAIGKSLGALFYFWYLQP